LASRETSQLIKNAFLKHDGDPVAHPLANGLQDLALHRQLVPPITQRHE
jgi:hypothetical protein